MAATKTHKRYLPQKLLQAREALMGQFRPLLRSEGLTDQQWRIMRILRTYDMLEPRELCVLCNISSSSIVGVLSRMESSGLIVRSRMLEDQRRVRVKLTPSGAEKASRLAPKIAKAYHEVEDRLGKESIEDLYKLLDKLDSIFSLEPNAHTHSVTASPKDDCEKD